MKTIQPLFEAFAIRQKSTGKFLPMRWNKARGYSFDEPSFEFPRLFKSRQSARAALSAWLRGEWKDPIYEHDEWGHGESLVGYDPVHKPSRDAADMEVISLTLEMPTPRELSA